MVARVLTAIERDLADVIASSRDEMLAFTRELVAIASENPPGVKYTEAVDAIRSRLATLGLADEVVMMPPSPEGDRRAAVMSGWGEGRTLYFHGHYDVVPASVEGQFEPTLYDDALFGRGSADMKGGLAAMLYAVSALRRCRAPIEGRVGLTFVPDEETGGAFGSRFLTDSGRLGRDGMGMLTPEPTSGVVWNANRGALTLEVTVKGRSAHVGLQHQGINAFERMVKVVNRLVAHKAEVERQRTAFAIQPAAAAHSILLLGGRVEGGSNFNVVPERCCFTIDRRFNPEEDLEAVRGALLAVLDAARAEGVELDVRTLQEGMAAGTLDTDPVARALAASIEQVTGEPPAFEMCPGLLETRFYVERGLPAFAYGPGALAVAHGPKEFVKVSRIVECVQIYALTAWRLLGA